MKNKFYLLCMVLLFGLSYSYASFPVNKEKAKQALVTTDDNAAENLNQSEAQEQNFKIVEAEEDAISPAVAGSYNKWIAVALWFFLGGFAAHRWYAGKPVGWNILFILTLGGLGVWWVIDLVNILNDNF